MRINSAYTRIETALFRIFPMRRPQGEAPACAPQQHLSAPPSPMYASLKSMLYRYTQKRPANAHSERIARQGSLPYLGVFRRLL